MTAPIHSIRDPKAIARAVRRIEKGDLIVIPTDTIYGLATHPQNVESIHHLYEVRERSPEPALPFLLADATYLEDLARPTRVAQYLARRFWPGLLTLILAPAAGLTPALRASPIALRVPNFPHLTPLLEAAGGYLFASGAICAGYPPAITAREAAELFGDQVAMILDGGHAPFGIPSTILDCVPDPPVIRRRGALDEEKVWDALGLPAPAREPSET